ncbi:hypothetical protein ACOSP6_01650 [Tenacibaculum sp. MEBiC06402]|uniref:hypothetical protein n=1 Tax=unclassified Tenacibaculum TaxID=2635139 RepID=UPI003B993384
MKKMVLVVFFATLLSSCEAIFVDNISDDTVEVLAPVNETVMAAGTITFSWKTLEGADAYKVRIATPNFLNATQIVADTLVTKTSFTNILEAGEYEWVVYGVNSEYQSLEEIYSLNLN